MPKRDTLISLTPSSLGLGGAVIVRKEKTASGVFFSSKKSGRAEFSLPQLEYIHSSNSRINIAEGAVRSGKTFSSLIRWIKYIAVDAPPGDLLMVGVTDRALKRNVIVPMRQLIGPDMRYYPSLGEIRVWGRTIYVVGARNKEAEHKIRGMTLAGAYGDEVTLWDKGFWKMLLSRLSVDDAKFFGTTNPDSPRHWLKKEVIDNPKIDCTSFRFKLDDNPILSETFKNNLKAEYTGLWYKRYILSEWAAAEGVIHDYFSEQEPFVIPCRPAPPEYYIVGIDYGTVNPTVFSLIGVNQSVKPRAWTERLYYYCAGDTGVQKDDSQYIADLKDFLGDIRPRYFYPDPSARSFNILLRRAYTGVRDVDNTVIDGIRTVSTLHKTGEYAIINHPSCKPLIEEKYQYCWDERAQARGKDEPLKVRDHCNDAERYALYNEFGLTDGIDYTSFTKW